MDFDARIAALDKYVAAQESLSSSSEIVGGTVVHVRHIGSFSLPYGSSLWAGILTVTLVVIVASALFLRRPGRSSIRAT